MAFKRDDIEQYPYIAYTDDSNGLPVLEIHVIDVEGGSALDRTWREIRNAVLSVIVTDSDEASARSFVVASIVDDGGYGTIVDDLAGGEFKVFVTDNPNGYPMMELG